MLFGDLYNIEGRIKEISSTLSIIFDNKDFVYKVLNNGEQVMTVPAGELDSRLLLKLRKNNLRRQRLQDYIYQIEQAELEKEKREERHFSNEIQSATLDRISPKPF